MSLRLVRLLILAGLLAMTRPSAAHAGGLLQFLDRVTLPNGMVLKREFDGFRGGWVSARRDLFAPNRGPLLSRDVDFVRFDDRYVYVRSRRREAGGPFDAQSDDAVPIREAEAIDRSGLPLDSSAGCFRGWLGPGLPLDDAGPPFTPPCGWRNLKNQTLRAREWFDRPCSSAPSPSR